MTDQEIQDLLQKARTAKKHHSKGAWSLLIGGFMASVMHNPRSSTNQVQPDTTSHNKKGPA